MTFLYKNIEIKETDNGEKIVRKVQIKNGKGFKELIKYKKGKKTKSVKKPIHIQHMDLIKGGKFIKGLFADCKNCSKTRKRKSLIYKIIG